MTKQLRTDTFAHAISGVLARRAEMMDEVAQVRERLAVLSNDIEAMDRVLETLGYQGEIKLTPRVPRIVLFYRGELRQFLAGQMRENGPMTSRQMAEALALGEGKDARDRRMMNDIVRRMGKALRQMVDAGIVTRTPEKVRGEYWWRLSDSTDAAKGGLLAAPREG
jgi:hypothetical protein